MVWWISRLEKERKSLQTQTESLQSERNTQSKSIGQAKAKGEDVAPLLAGVAQLGVKLGELKSSLDLVPLHPR